MADVIFYSTGEIFWVNDPPFGKPHIGVPQMFPAVPPDHLFSYSRCAHTLESAGHTVIGAYGRQRQEIRATGGPDPQILSLGDILHPERTVLVLIATDSDKQPRGSDMYPRVRFTAEERASVDKFRKRGGGLYVTWDHGQLGYESLQELGLDGPLEPEPTELFRPNVSHSHDSTCEAKVATTGSKLLPDGTRVPTEVWLSVGPPAGYLQKIVPAQLLYRNPVDKSPDPKPPHPIFNGVGGSDGIWIPAHMHEGIFKGAASLQGLQEEGYLPDGVRYLAIHVPFTETTFVSFAVMAYKDSEWVQEEGKPPVVKDGRIIWDTSFHHLVDINWSSNGKVPWDAFAPFSAEALWKQQLPAPLFEERMERGMKRLFANAIKWLAHTLPEPPANQVVKRIRTGVPKGNWKAALTAFAISDDAVDSSEKQQDSYPTLEGLNH